MNIRKDDTVLVISGKYRGKKGKVLKAIPGEDRLVVEGVNIHKKHQRPTKDLPKGGIIEKESPIHRACVMLVCPRCSRPTRIRAKVVDGKKVRACAKCGEAIDK
ncbi:MAG TPA: 50S ribosomal protein L24 [Firmicutes bacterium]|uniref:Large ribosomal subunit protein uL24 n=1 Tax=Candidatus Fermentithermobacillus carboniphilus TaxID=3085328 RepID=A0AAT9LB09_9FIRM|nr:MAG: 50S ribosomal protein L24 [Candidatus Fermentithermobacillus carboniphilus]HHW18375.1 50S ribosomal protein L24 [Candidatus Fermentithermobacillaceae bacterium]